MLNKVRDSLYTKSKKNKYSSVIDILIAIVLVVLVAEICFMANFSGVYVVGSSMNPTLAGAESEDERGGDYVYIDKYAEPDYGDIVVVYFEPNGYLIKRVVALGGDRVKLIGGTLYVKHKGELDFKLVEEDYILPENNHPEYPNNTFPHDDEGYLVQDGHLFLMGDNRDESYDSRKFGSVPRSKLQGVVTSWSFNFKKLNTAVHSFFKFDVAGIFK